MNSQVLSSDNSKPLRLYSSDGKFFDSDLTSLLIKDRNFLLGWKCTAGYESLLIDSKGDIYSAACKTKGVYGRNGTLGNIFNNDLQINKEFVNCPKKNCQAIDLAIPKFKKKKFQKIIDTRTFPFNDKFTEHTDSIDELKDIVAIKPTNNTSRKNLFWDISSFDEQKLDNKTIISMLDCLETYALGQVVNFHFFTNKSKINKNFERLVSYITIEKGHHPNVYFQKSIDPQTLSRLIPVAEVEYCLNLRNQNIDEYLLQIGELKIGIDKKSYPLSKQYDIQISIPESHNKPSYLRKVDFNSDIFETKKLKIKARNSGNIKSHIPYRFLFLGQNDLDDLSYETKFLPNDHLYLQKFQDSPQSIDTNPNYQHRTLCFIPMRNCEDTIENTLSHFDKEVLNYIDEILIVDNDSEDNSVISAQLGLSNLKGIAKTILKSDKNYGFGGSHKLALKYAYQHRYDHILIVHGDGSANVKEFIPILEDKSHLKYDYVLSNRLALGKSRKNYSLLRFFANKILNLLVSILFLRSIKDYSCGPINIIKTKNLISRDEEPSFLFSNLISFMQECVLHGLVFNKKIKYQSINYKDRGDKSFYSCYTQFLKSILMILKVRFKGKKLYPHQDLSIVTKFHALTMYKTKK